MASSAPMDQGPIRARGLVEAAWPRASRGAAPELGDGDGMTM